MIVVTAATGHLGRHVVDQLLKRVPAGEIAVAVRNVEKAADLAALGVDVRYADYEKPESLADAFRGTDKVLLISASEIGKRLPQHRNAVEAIKNSGAKLLAYTSILKADTSGIGLAKEHLATEEMIRESGVPFVFLRDGWYLENYTEHFGPALQYGAINGVADDGKVSAAARADFAAAAVEALTGSGHENQVYELAGDEGFTLSELAAELSRASGKTIVYNDVTPEQYRAILVGAGLPEFVADMFVDWDLAIKRGELVDDSKTLSRLIGRPTQPLADAVAAAVKG
ncbi:MAG: SDR family oxidoreductase [Acidobacteria bacterium]|nr:SDR family oxidoreductase [Acidobacteriota bacterium]